MQPLRLRNNFQRACWLLIVCITASLLFFLVYHNLNVRFISDSRFKLDRDGLNSIHQAIPQSPRLNLRLAESYLVEAAATEEAARLAASHAASAANRSLWDYRTAYTLGTILELNGDITGAEAALRNAVRLSPRYKRANWALGNLLLRQGRLDESLNFLKAAARIDSTLYPVLYDRFQLAAGGDLSLADRLTADDPVARLSFVQYLLEKAEFERALQFFPTVDPQVRSRSPLTLNILINLIDTGHVLTARRLWNDLQSQPSPNSQNLLWNGDFETSSSIDNAADNTGSAQLASLFNWNFKTSSQVRFGIDTVSAGTGTHALRLMFLGSDTTTLRNEIRQLAPLKPGSRYRIDFAFRTKDFQSPLGPRVAIVTDSQVIAQSSPIPNGTSDAWQRATFEFSAPSDNGRKFISIIRQPAFSYDDPSTGVVWFDDFLLTDISSTTANSSEQ